MIRHTSYICRMKFRVSLFPYTLFPLFLLFSCGESGKTVTVPADVLPKEKMALVITDIHIAEAEASLKPYQDTTSEKLNFQALFEKNKITKEQYEKSMAFYIDHPELLNEVYENVLNELSGMQGEAAKQ